MMTLSDSVGESDSKTPQSQSMLSAIQQEQAGKANPKQHDCPSDSATPETGADDADTSENHEDEMDLPLSGGDTPDLASLPAANVAAHLSQKQPAATRNQTSPRPFKRRIPSLGDESLVEFDYGGANNLQKFNSEKVQRKTPVISGSGKEEEDRHSESPSTNSDEDYSYQSDGVLWKCRLFCGGLVNHEYVQIGIIVLILVNALLMGLATFDFVADDPQVDQIFQRVDKAFLVIFTIECAMQLVYLGASLFADGWLVFDLLIVVLSWSFESLQIIRAFRIFRAFRLITRVKPLRDLVLAIGAVMPRMYAIASLLLLIFYIFSVLFTELFSDLPLSDTYFKTLDTSLFTCMEMMTLEWGDISREVMLYEPWAWAPFSAFIIITGFIVFNLIVAVVCDAVAITEKQVRELDGFESDNPEQKLYEAQERIDLLQLHINDMLRTQGQVQELIEMMASELLNIEAERTKAEHREAELRIEVSRREEYEKRMQSPEHIEVLERTYIQEKGRREQERKSRALQRQASSREQEQKEKSQRLIGVPIPERMRPKRRGSTNSLLSTLSFRRSDSFAASRSLEGADESENSANSSRGLSVKDTSKRSTLRGGSSHSRD